MTLKKALPTIKAPVVTNHLFLIASYGVVEVELTGSLLRASMVHCRGFDDPLQYFRPRVVKTGSVRSLAGAGFLQFRERNGCDHDDLLFSLIVKSFHF